jgi:hypothetical protein
VAFWGEDRAAANACTMTKQGTTHFRQVFQLFIFSDSGRYLNLDDCPYGRVSPFMWFLHLFSAKCPK